MDTNEKETMDQEKVRQEVQILLNDVSEHSIAMNHVSEALKQIARGDVSLLHLDALRDAMNTFAPAKKSLELAKKIVTARIKARLAE